MGKSFVNSGCDVFYVSLKAIVRIVKFVCSVVSVRISPVLYESGVKLNVVQLSWVLLVKCQEMAVDLVVQFEMKI